jgi:hypothetical protein
MVDTSQARPVITPRISPSIRPFRGPNRLPESFRLFIGRSPHYECLNLGQSRHSRSCAGAAGFGLKWTFAVPQQSSPE